ncbi:MAG: DNA primase [Actinobacteria bacterium]|nr:DNA primase [Actinomycetota bacterium]
MAGRIRRDDIDTLRERASIVEVVGDHTSLKRAGPRMKGLCPFHSERTPSFTVDPSSNLYYCFGCGAGGDIFRFLMEIEGLEFTEAVEQLARRTGYELKYEEMSAGEKAALGQRTKLVAVTTAALAFFRDRLYREEGAVARDYLKSRGFTKEDAEHFQVGYAPNEWEALSRHLVEERRFPRREVIEAGLAVDNEKGGLRDRFRGRLIFPVLDLSGDVIGFGGRVLPGLDYGDFDPPKYYNSPETPLYKKTRVLYGIHEARPDIVRAEAVLICEGYTDVMALHQGGFGNAVATCGTAVGPDHLRIVGRYARDVVLAFDADEAGMKAATRAWEAAREVEAETTADTGARFDLKVLVLPSGTDPADFVRTEGIEALRAAVDGATPVVPFLLRRLVVDADLGSEEGRTAALRDALELLRQERDQELRRQYVRSEIADRIGLSVEFVEKTAARMGVQLDTHAGADLGSFRPRRVGSRGTIANTTPQRAAWERTVLRLALQEPDLLPDEWFELTEDDFTHPTARAVYRALVAAGGAGVDVRAVLDAAADDDVRAVVLAVSMEEGPEGDARRTARDLVRRLVAERLEAERSALEVRLQTLHHEIDREEWLALNGELVEVLRRHRELTAFDD